MSGAAARCGHSVSPALSNPLGKPRPSRFPSCNPARDKGPRLGQAGRKAAREAPGPGARLCPGGTVSRRVGVPWWDCEHSLGKCQGTRGELAAGPAWG